MIKDVSAEIMIDTRTSNCGRKPTLRDDIFTLLLNVREAMTVKEIAIALRKNVTTPFRALKDLQRNHLVKSISTEDGTAYFVNMDEYKKRNIK